MRFNYVGSGLMVGLKTPYLPTQEVVGGTLALFSIAGATGSWYWATATIVGNTVELTSPSVASPKKVSYACWQNPLGANLYNRDGLPASPFYVDDVTAKYTVTASAPTNGSISPSGTTTYLKRATALYTITPDSGYHIQNVLVDGASVGSVKYCTFRPAICQPHYLRDVCIDHPELHNHGFGQCEWVASVPPDRSTSLRRQRRSST